MTEEKASDSTSFVLRDVFPDALAVFQGLTPPLETAIADCDVVLDTNVLLLPYRAGKESLEGIAGVFRALKEQRRLFVPGQVAREFALRRASMIAELVQRIADQRARVVEPPSLGFPLLEGLAELTAVQNAEATLRGAAETYTSSLADLLAHVESWGRNDPVSVKYSEIFSIDTLSDPEFDMAKMNALRSHRYANKIPPGYKDAAKDDGGIGDLLIWKTILKLGEERKRHLVFVSGEEKADWQHRSNNRGLMPRAELIDEYRRSSQGKGFYLVQLSRLLELLGAQEGTVRGVRSEEAKLRQSAIEDVVCPLCSQATSCSLAQERGASAMPLCESCGKKFHVHRTRFGIIVRIPRSRKTGAEHLRDWFLKHYKDPADGVPYDSKEGGYIYTAGGPFDPHDVLHNQFADRYPDDLIDEVADDLVSEVGPDWVRVEDY